MRILGYIGAFICFFIPLLEFLATQEFYCSPLAVVGICILYKLDHKAKSATSIQKHIALHSGNEELDRMNRECFKKAVSDYEALEAAIPSITDTPMQMQLKKMQHISRRFLMYLQDHPEKIGLSRHFIEYYQDRAVMLTKKFQDLEKTGLTTEEVLSTQKNIKNILMNFDEAYEKEFTKVLNAQIMDLEAEMKVMKQTMKNEGIENGKESVEYSDGAVENLDGARPVFTAPESKTTEDMRQDMRASYIQIPDSLRHDVKMEKIINGVLGIFLGGFGIHKFYQRKYFQGILYILFCWSSIPALIGFIEGLRYLFMGLDDYFLSYYLPRHSKY